MRISPRMLAALLVAAIAPGCAPTAPGSPGAASPARAAASAAAETTSPQDARHRSAKYVANGNFEAGARELKQALPAATGVDRAYISVDLGRLQEAMGDAKAAEASYRDCLASVGPKVGELCQEGLVEMPKGLLTREQVVAMAQDTLGGGEPPAAGAAGSVTVAAAEAASPGDRTDCVTAMPAACTRALSNAQSYAERVGALLQASSINNTSTAAACIMGVARDANYACAEAFRAEGRNYCADQAMTQAYQYDISAKQAGEASALSLDPGAGAPTASNGRLLCDFEGGPTLQSHYAGLEVPDYSGYTGDYGDGRYGGGQDGSGEAGMEAAIGIMNAMHGMMNSHISNLAATAQSSVD